MKGTALHPALVLVLVLAPLLLAACGGGGSGVSAQLRTAALCTSLGLGGLDTIFEEITDLLAAIGGTLPPNATYTPPDYSITTSLGTIAGSVTSTDDISDGIDPGEAASASWNLTPLSGAIVTGNGTFSLARATADLFQVGGRPSASPPVSVSAMTSTPSITT